MTGPALEGDLRHFSAAEVLQLVHLAGGTGRLELERRGERVELLVERGRPTRAHTDGASVRVGEMLLHRGAITTGSLERALSEQRARPLRRLGALLVEAGSATREQVAVAVRECSKRIIYGLMLWGDGRFRFFPGEIEEDDGIRLDLELDRLILEGLREADHARRP